MTKKILHVDDHLDHLTLTKLYLLDEDSSFVIDTAQNHVQALRLVEENTYDCILLDYAMPVMNGLELAKKIKEIKDTPIILYTAKGNRKVEETSYEIGIDAYIEKLMELDHYHYLVKRIIQITEKYASFKKMKQEWEMYGDIIRSSPYLICLIDQDMNILYSNNMEFKKEEKHVNIHELLNLYCGEIVTLFDKNVDYEDIYTIDNKLKCYKSHNGLMVVVFNKFD